MKAVSTGAPVFCLLGWSLAPRGANSSSSESTRDKRVSHCCSHFFFAVCGRSESSHPGIPRLAAARRGVALLSARVACHTNVISSPPS